MRCDDQSSNKVQPHPDVEKGTQCPTDEREGRSCADNNANDSNNNSKDSNSNGQSCLVAYMPSCVCTDDFQDKFAEFQDQFETDVRRFILDNLDILLFHGMKALMIFCIFSTLCLLAAGCCNGSLQLVMIVHNAFGVSHSQLERKILMFVTIPLLLAIWAFISAYVMSYTIEIAHAVLLIPMKGRGDPDGTEKSHLNQSSDPQSSQLVLGNGGHPPLPPPPISFSASADKTNESSHANQSFRLADNLTKKWEFTNDLNEPITISIFCASLIVFGAALTAAFFQRFDYAGALFALSLIIYVLRSWVFVFYKKRPRFSVAAIGMACFTIICSLISGVVLLCNVHSLSSTYTAPAITKLLLVFVGVVAASTMVVLLIQLTWIPATSGFDSTKFKMFIAFLQGVAAVLLFISFWLEWSATDESLTASFMCVAVAEIFLCFSLVFSPVKSICEKRRLPSNSIQLVGVTLTIFAFIAAGSASLLSNTSKFLSTVFGLFIAGILIYLCAVCQPSFLRFGDKVSVGSLLFIVLLFCLIALYAASNAGVMLLYVALVLFQAVNLFFHHLKLDKQNQNQSSTQTPTQCDPASFRYYFSGKPEKESSHEPESESIADNAENKAKAPAGSFSDIYPENTQNGIQGTINGNPAETSSKTEDQEDLCIGNIVIAHTGKTRRKRFHPIIFAVCVILNAAIYFFAVWSVVQSFDVSNVVDRPKTPIADGDIYRSPTALNYPICSQSYNHMSIIDASYLAEMTYLYSPTRVGVSCGLSGNATDLQLCIDEYFTPAYKSSLGVPFNWTVMDLSVPTSAYSSSNSAYFGIKSDSHKMVVVGVRGSTTGRDWLEDMNLYSEISMMQVFSFVIPLVYIWPTDLIAIGVKAMSFMSSLSFLQRNARGNSNKRTMAQSYYLEVERYLNSLQSKDELKGYEFFIIGHSLGGAVAGIVGACNKVRSIGFDPPGLIHSYRKFDIDGAAATIFQTSTTIIRNYDPVPLVDRHAGEIAYLDCPVTFYSAYCHNIHSITCQLSSNCQLMDSTPFNSFGGGYEYCRANM